MKHSLGLLVFFLPLATLADVVVTADSVESYVNIRAEPNATSDIVGQLNRGSPRKHVATEDNWHEVELADGGTGFVHGDWALVVADEPAAEAAAETPESADAGDTRDTGDTGDTDSTEVAVADEEADAAGNEVAEQQAAAASAESNESDAAAAGQPASDAELIAAGG